MINRLNAMLGRFKLTLRPAQWRFRPLSAAVAVATIGASRGGWRARAMPHARRRTAGRVVRGVVRCVAR